jgi:hypothetical protein
MDKVIAYYINLIVHIRFYDIMNETNPFLYI